MDHSIAEARSGRSAAIRTPRRLAFATVAVGGLVALAVAGVALLYVGRNWPGAPFVALAALTAAAASFAGLFVLHRERRRLDADRTILARAFDGARAARAVTGPDGRTVHANKLFDVLFGRRADGRDVFSLAGVEPEANFQLARLSENAASGVMDSAEFWLPVRGRAQRRRIEAQAEPLDGFPGHVLWRFEDVTVRHEMDQVIRGEQSKLVDFMDHAPVGFFSVDAEGRFLFANATLARWLGTTPIEMTSGRARLHDFVVPPPRNAEPWALFEGGADDHGETWMRGYDGRMFQASIAQSVVSDEGGGMLRTRSVVRDLTPERKWQEALRRSEQRFQRFFEDAPIGVALLDDQGRVAECNAVFVKMAGLSVAEIKGRSLSDLLTADERGEAATHLPETLKGQEMAGPLEVKLRGASDRAASLYARRMEEAPGQGFGFILHLIDVTEQKNLEIQFAQSQKMQAIGQLAGGVAHDFNNLLTAMIGFCDLLLLRHKPGDQSFGDIMQIKQNANRAANLVRQLLAFSRQQTLQPKVMDITDALAELSNLLRRLIGENIELRMIHGRDLGLVRVDQGQFEQVIINLAVNARDAMPDGGELTIKTGNLLLEIPQRRAHEDVPAGEYVTIEVADTGAGIAPEHIERIFEPFFSTKEIGAGTGLGLSTVYGIVRQTGGFVFVDSAPGAGARFTILLPRHRPKKQEADAHVEQPRERIAHDLTGVGGVLLVEDEDAVRMFSARALRNKGYNVMEARSGEEALGVLADPNNRVDLLVSDVVMPQMDGPTLIREVRRTRPDLKVIFISGYTEDRFRQHFGEDDVIHFLAKPFSLKQLAAKVKEVMDGDA